MQTEKMDQKTVVRKIIGRIQDYVKTWKNSEAEICIGIIELEKLEAHRHYGNYASFAELMEGEFGWSELYFARSKKLLEVFGPVIYREYGRDLLTPMLRLDFENDRTKVFDRINEYKLRKNNRLPSYGVVNSWVNEVSGQINHNNPPEKIVDIKSRYIKVLEENKLLKDRVNHLEQEIARLNVFIKNRVAADKIITDNTPDPKGGRPRKNQEAIL